MKDEDGELHNIMLFVAEGCPNRYPIDWYASSNYSDRNGKNVLIGWMLSVPREVGVAIVRDIYGVDQHVVGKGDWIVSDSKDIIKTLSVKPRSNLQLLRNENSLEHVASVSVNGLSQVLNSTGASFELIAEVADFERGSKVGFEVRRSSTGDEVATIVYDDAEKKMIIDRPKGLTADCAVSSEKLGFHVFVDVSRVEVFVNNRF
ncbi:hypothetical protein F444_01314 [Phytophthora nicotianae P1976]|uniref:Glycosyl hydrolase family 32 C-terminal domain-containing protein n=1 Tax=Phytophthora nicotianae P1976 TaxID=1317066 RepID=A0A081B116_PHYNI|nr:hypothetical protein F444_01314 [Phytophthora nicotianae P1976]